MFSIFQLAKGKRDTVHSGIAVTTTSTPQKANGHNAMTIFFDIIGSGTWTIKIQGKAFNGTWCDMYDQNGNLMAISSATADKAQNFIGIPETFRIVATEDVNGATCSVCYELFSV